MRTATLKGKKARIKKNKTLSLAPPSLTMRRPRFSAKKQQAARLEASLATGIEYSRTNLTVVDLAAPHRAPYSKIRDLVLEGKTNQVRDSINELIKASSHYEAAFRGVSSELVKHRYHKLANLYKETRLEVQAKLEDHLGNPDDIHLKKELIRAVNNLASNAPGLGPHKTTNLLVSDRLHIQATGMPREPVTPRSKAALKGWGSESAATTNAGAFIVSPDGNLWEKPPMVKNIENISLDKDRVLRGSLRVDEGGNVYKPKGKFEWSLVS